MKRMLAALVLFAVGVAPASLYAKGGARGYDAPVVIPRQDVQSVPGHSDDENSKSMSPVSNSDWETPEPGQFSMMVTVNARHYSELEDVLRRNDRVGISVCRSSPDEPITDEQFKEAIGVLNGIDESVIGVYKSLVFSSVEDLDSYLSDIPPDVAFIGYNVEGGMTPEEERMNIVASVRRFASLVHGRDDADGECNYSCRRMSFAPVVSYWDAYEKRGWLDDIILLVDVAVIQGQNILAQGGPEVLAKFVDEKSTLFREYDPSIAVSVQVWLPKPNSIKQAIAGLEASEDYMDVATVFSPYDFDAVRTVLEEWLGR